MFKMPLSTRKRRKRLERDFACIEKAVSKLDFEYWRPPRVHLITPKEIYDYNVWIRTVCKGLKTRPKVQASHNLKTSKRKQ
jgi:hypothetical protein